MNMFNCGLDSKPMIHTQRKHRGVKLWFVHVSTGDESHANLIASRSTGGSSARNKKVALIVATVNCQSCLLALLSCLLCLLPFALFACFVCSL